MDTCPVCGKGGHPIFSHPEARILRCDSCGHCFSVVPPENQEEYDEEYFIKTHRRWFEKPDLGFYLYVSKAIGSRNGRLLDVGCGTGALLSYLHRRHSSLELDGIDLSAPGRLEGMRLLQGDFLEYEFDGLYDIITSLHAIEHFGDVRGYIRRITELARPGAVVIIATAAENSLLFGLARVFKRLGVSIATDRLYSKHHLNHFTTHSLRRLVEDHGLRYRGVLIACPPMASIDTPETGNALIDGLLRFSLFAIHWISNLTGTGYHQTLICEKR